MKRILIAGIALIFCLAVQAQTLTMSNKCWDRKNKAYNLLREKKYQDALQLYKEMEDNCKTKDAKQVYWAGRAEAYNGLGQYSEAIQAADQAIKVSKNKNLQGYFQKAIALNKLGQPEAARENLQKLIALTERNQNTKERANNYALMASLHARQLNNSDSAFYFLDKATGLDPGNVNFVIVRGDIYFDQKKYDQAFAEYDNAVKMGKADLEMYTIRSDARLKQMTDSYGTSNAQELRSKLSSSDKEKLCVELKKALELGLSDMQKDMFAGLVCK